jgi:hypothetical protein
MNEREREKKTVEEEALEAFLDAYTQITGREIANVRPHESPDFLYHMDRVPHGIEVAVIRGMKDEFDYLHEVWRLADQKNHTYRRHARFDRPIILVLYSDGPALWEVHQQITSSLVPEDYDDMDFSEIWLMCRSDMYFSAHDPRRPADLYAIKPAAWRGFHRIGYHDREPWG